MQIGVLSQEWYLKNNFIIQEWKWTNEINFGEWYLWSQAIITGVSSLIVLLIYFEAKTLTQNSKLASERDAGTLFIGLAISTWSIWAVLEIITGQNLPDVIRHVASALNSAFFLLAVSFFEYGPQRIPFFNDRWRYVLVILPIAIFVWALLLLPSAESSIPDIAFSLLTCLVISYPMVKSLRARSLPLLGWVAALIILYVFIHSVVIELLDELNYLEVFTDSEQRWIVNLTSKTALIFVCFAILFSWAHEHWIKLLKKEDFTIRQQGNIARLTLTGEEMRDSQSNRTRWRVLLKIEGNEKEELITPAQHNLLFAFAIVRQLTDSSHFFSSGWIYKKSNSDVYRNDNSWGALYFFYHEDLKRLSKGLKLDNDVLFESDRKGNWRLWNSIHVSSDVDKIIQDEKHCQIYKSIKAEFDKEEKRRSE